MITKQLHSEHEPRSKILHNEIGVISLTSWTKRIASVGLTIFSIYRSCPNFHICLTLSLQEFPNKFYDLPDDVKCLCQRNILEILWVDENVKSLKKILYCIERYTSHPIISADDDLIYTCNYAKELYDLWRLNSNKICTINAEQPLHTNGTATLYFPGCFGDNPVDEMLNNPHRSVYEVADDGYYELLRAKYGIQVAYLRPHMIWEDRNGSEPLHDIYGKPGFIEKLREIQSIDLGRPIGL